MARTDLTITNLDDSGVAVGAGTAGTVDGASFRNSGREFLVLKNSGVGAHTVTVQTGSTRGDLAVAERTVALAAGQEKLVGPFSADIYNQRGLADHGKVFVDYDATPGEVAASVFRIPR